MNAPALPAYLQNRQSQGVAARATAGMGGVLPPHISIKGNQYTLVDAAGNKQSAGAVMYACIADISDVVCKRYYKEPWKEGSNEPPTCWSSNGVGPSRDSVDPQARSCAECQWNVRGSDTSMNDKPIKACRDEKYLALILPQFPTMTFQLVLTPGSFKNWMAFMAPFNKHGADPSDVIVQFGFQMQTNGVMEFRVATDQQGNGVYLTEALFNAREQALAAKATDVLVGRNDVPIALPAARAPSVQEIAHVTTEAAAKGAFGANVQQDALAIQAAQGQFGGQPAAQVPFGQASPSFGGAPSATNLSTSTGMQSTNRAPVDPASTTSPSEPAKPQRTRRTREQIAADNAAKAAQTGSPPPNPAVSGQPTAPFPVQPSGAAAFGAAPAAPQGFGGQPATAPGFAAPIAAAAAPAGNGQSFGIQQGADPNVDPALAEMLRGLGQ